MNIQLIDGPFDGADIGDPIAPSIWPTWNRQNGSISYYTSPQQGRPRYDRCGGSEYVYVGDSQIAEAA